jgi:hypothetical protein
MTVMLDQGKWERWKAQLALLADTENVSQDDVRRCVDSLRDVETAAPAGSAGPVVAPSTTAAFRTPPERNDAATQLRTVHPIHYAHHLLTKVKRERQVRKLASQVGYLGATLYAVAESLWHLLLYMHRPQKQHDSSSLHLLERTSTTAVPAAPQSPSPADPLISAQTAETLRTLLARSVSFDYAVVSAFATSPLLPCPTREDAATQTSRTIDATADNNDSAEGKKRQPFLCRRCRQDGRAAYEYDHEMQRLSYIRTPLAEQRARQLSATLIAQDVRPPTTRFSPLSERKRHHTFSHKQSDNKLPLLLH